MEELGAISLFFLSFFPLKLQLISILGLTDLTITHSTQDFSHILHVFLGGVVLFTPLRERDLYCKN